MEKIIYSKSLKAKLVLNRGFMIESYGNLMNVIKTHKDVNVNSSFFKERITFGKNNIALIKGFKKNLVVYFNLKPSRVSKKIGFQDVSETISYKKYPVKLIVEDEKDLEDAEYLMERALLNAGASEIAETEDTDYNEVFKEESFDDLLNEGLIKKYVRYFADKTAEDYGADTTALPVEEKAAAPAVEMVTVNFKVMVKGEKAEELYLFTNYTNWEASKALKMEKKEDMFVLTTEFPKNYELEFKVSYSDDWNGVEKGMFGEEIQNHKYTLNTDKTIEDIVHNFRK